MTSDRLTRRRTLGAAGAGGLALAAPSLARGQNTRTIPVTPMLGALDHTAPAQQLGELLAAISGGSLVLDVRAPAAAPELVGYDTALIGASYLLSPFDPAFAIFSSVPFGLGPREFEAWVQHGGGQPLWDDLASRLDFKPLLVGDHGVRAGGWFPAPVEGPDSFRGLTMNVSGLGATAVVSMQGSAVSLPADKVGGVQATASFELGLDLDLGFAEAFPVLHTPSLFEPHGAVALYLPASLWSQLGETERIMIDSCCGAQRDHMVGAAVTAEVDGFDRLAAGGVSAVEIRPETFAALAGQVLPALDDHLHDSAGPGIFGAYRDFMTAVSGWTAIGDGAFSVARAKALGI